MFGHKNNRNGEKVFRYSIRKYHFGAASVAVAALLFFANGVARADSLSVSPDTATTEKTLNDEGRSRAKEEPLPDSQELAERNLEEKTAKVVDKSALLQVMDELKDIVVKVKESKLAPLSNQLLQLTDESKRLLSDKDAKSEDIEQHILKIRKLIETLKEQESSASQPERKEESKVPSAEAVDETANQAESSNAKDSLLEDKSTNEAATEVRKEETSRDSSKPTVTASDRSLNKVDKEANSLELPNKDNKLLPIDTKSNLVDEATEDVLDKKKKGYSGFRIAHYAARSIDRSVAGNLDSGTISGDGVKQFENLHYDIDGDRTIWRVAVRPAHKNHAWAGIAVTSDDTIENIRVVERGGAGGSVLEEREISRGRPASTPFSNYKMFIGHYRLIGGAVPDRIVYEVTTRGTHHNLFARFATAIVQNTLENSGLSGKAAITSRNSDFPAVGIHVNAVGAPTVNHNYTRTNDTVRMQTVPSTDNQLSGTGKPGATISVKKNGNTFKRTKVDGSGHWVVSLDAGLNSNLSDTGEQLVPKDKITVTQSVDGKESEATNVDVSLGRSWIDHSPGHPVGEITSNQRNIKLFVPHDAGMAYLKYRDTNNQEHQVAIRRTTINQQWQSLQSNLATVTSVDNTSNKFYSIINLKLNSDMKVGSQTSVISNMKEGGYGSLEGWKPVNVVEAPLTSGAHIESDLTGKASIPAEVRVKAPVGSTVKLYDNNDVLIGEAQAGNDGYATVHPRNSLPEGQIRATSTPVGGKESAKSDPVTVTRTQIGHGGAKQVSSEGKARATIGVDKEWVTAYRGDHVEVNVSTYAKYLEKFLPNPNTRGHVKGLEESGGFLVTAQSTPETARTGKTSGTIAMDQPLGPTVLNYYVVSKTTTANYGRHNAGSSTNVSTTINVLEVAKKYDISIDKKITVDNPNAVSTPEKEKIIAAIKEKNNRTYTDAAYRALLDQATYSVDEKGNVTITYPDNSVDKVASSYTIQKRPVIETSLVDKADTQTPITVSADPGSKVKLYDHSSHELGEGTANESGRVTINPTRPIPNGNVTAKATDNRDNTTDASAPKQATVPAPQALTIQQPSHGSTSVTITPQGRTDIISAVIQGKKVKIEKEGSGRYKTLENAANVRISPNANGSVTFELPSGTSFETLDRIQATAENKDITVASGIRSSQEVSQYVLANKGEKVPVKDINRLTSEDKERVKTAYEKANPGINKSEVTVGSNGDITYNHQGRGSVQKGVAKTSDNVVLDNVAPGKPTIPTNLTDKAGTRTQIEVDTEPGASVVVYDHGGQELGRGVANANGKAVINPTKEIPKGNVTAKATDEAGNISQPSDAKVATFQDFTPKVPSKTPVTKVTSLTPDEVNQVKKKVSDANPGKEVQVSSNGTATVTDPKSRISHQISGDKLVESNDKIRPTVEIPYDNPARQEIYVYSGENNDITLKAWDNSGKISKLHLAFAADNRQGLGTEDSYLNGKTRSALYLKATKIHTDTPASQNSPAILKVTGEIPKGEFNEQSGQISRYLFAEDPSGNTNYEHVGHANDVGAPGRIRFVWKPQTFKYDAQAPGTPLLLDNADATQIENAVKQANPTFSDKIKSVTVDGNNVIVTYKDDSTDRLDASKVFKVRDSKPTSPMAIAPSDGTVTVTPTGDADKVTVNYTDEKEQNKTVTVVKDKNGTWSSSDKPAGVTVDSSTGQLLIPAEGVKDRSQVTATATKGDSRPSDPKIVTAQPKDFTPVKPDEKVPVKDKAHLTPEEKKQVEDKVKAKNPGKEVTVGEDGTATLKDPTTGISHQIPGSDLVNQGFTPVKPDEKVPVKDKAHLTPEEKKQVEDKVKAKNPGKEVTVGEDGTATLKDPTTGISHQIPGSDLVNQDFTPVKPDEKVPVKDKTHLTPEEKKQVEDKVKAKNPGKEVTVGEDGTATLKDPTTGISHQIPGSDLVNQDFTPVKPDEKVPVKDKAHLTPEEKKQVEDKVKAKNPGKEVTVGEDGTATLKDPTTGISHQIPGSDLVNQGFTPVKPDEKVPVKDKAHLTPEEKKQVEDKVKAKNPGKEVTVGEDGTATLKDPTTGISHQIPGSDLVNQDFTPVKPDEKVPVKDKTHLTPEEKKQVEDKVKAKNPGKEVTVGEDGTATLKDPTTGISHQIPGSDLVNQGFTPVKPDEKVPVKDKAHLTPEEKKQVEDKVKAKNPGKEVTVGEDGTATLKDPTTGISHQIPGSDLVNQGFTPVKPDEKVPVKDKAHLTPEEKKQVEDKVKAKNPGKEVTVGEDGTATLKDPTTGISHQIPGSDLVNQDFTPVKPDEKVPVKDKTHLTPEEKKQVEDKVKAKNPGKEVTVGEDGTATLKDPTTGISHQIPGSDLVNQDFTPVKPDEKVPVKDKAHLTPEEKKQVEDKVKAKNPGKEVTVGEDGTATLKDPTTGISHQIPGSDLVNQGFTPVKPDEKVPVKDKAHLTPEEKKQVEDKVKAKNPGKEVTVGEDGTATLKDPTTGISHQIPGSDLVNQGFTPVKPDEKVPVKDKTHLTPEEKKQVEDKVKAKNPGKEVTVGEDGTATLKDPTTGISHQIPGSDLVNQDFTPVKPDEKVPVKDKAHLTPEEKKQVEDKVKAKNPGKEVTVGEDGTATLKDPTTGISHQIPGSDLVNQGFTPVKPDEKVPVKDKAHLTPEEKKQVEDKVKAKNPGKEVTVGEDGTATLKDPTTGISHQIPGSDLVNQDFTPVKPDEKVPVKDKAHLTPEEKKQVEDKVKAKNPGKEVTVGEDGTATLKDPTTGISHQIPGSDLVNQDFTPVKPDEKVPVKDKTHLTPEEKKQVEDKVKAKNPGKEVTVGEDGTATLKDPTTGISHQIPGSDLVNQDFTPVKPDEKVPVKDKAHLTPEEKKQVEDKVKAKNPGKEVTVGEDGTATLKDPTTGISHQIPGSDLVNQGFTPVKPDEKVPVKDKTHLTPEEKKQVEDKVKAKNPGKEVTVGEDGTATLKDPTTGISHQIPGSDLVNQDFTPVKPDEKVPVKDKAHLTPEEKKQVEDKVKAKNPGKEVTVGEDGTATLKDPTTGISHQIPGSDLVNQGFTPVKPDEKVPVKDKAHLTPEEKKQVEDKVKAKNPGKEVTVGEDGTATLKDPTTGISHQIPGSDLVNQDFTPVKPDEKVPVKDKAHLTPEEKKQVEDKVKAKNPDKTVTVGEDGTATVTDPTTGISHQIPGTDLVNQDFTPVKPDEKVPAKDKDHLTPEEKKQVEDKVKAKNPGKEVTVGEDGTATLKDPTTGISHQIPGSDLVNQDFTPVKPDEKVPVKDKTHLTPEEKKQVEDKVKAKNPDKTVTVGEDGTTTVTDPTTGISHQIPGTDLVNQDFGVNGIPEVTPSQPAYTDPVGTSSTDGEGNVITPPTVDIPAYTDPVGTSSTDGEGNVITPPTVDIPAYTDPVGTSSTDGEGNVITPPTVDIPAYTDPVGTSSTDGEGNLITPPAVEIPAYTDPVGTSSTDGEGNVITPPTAEVPAYTGSVNGISEEMPAQPHKDGSANEMSEGTPKSVTTINKDRQLPNTGTEKSNTSLIAALLAAMTGGLLISRKRKDEE
ncbi:Ig-like domain-containing protein [Streptococcus sp. KHUD_015]